VEAFHHYWGKAVSDGELGTPSHHLLAWHQLDVAAVGADLLERDALLAQRLANLLSVSIETIHSWVPFLLATHDLGKFTAGFQSLAPAVRKALSGVDNIVPYAHRHDATGHFGWLKFVLPFLLEHSLVGNPEHDIADWCEALDPIASAVASHHGIPTLPAPVLVREFGAGERQAIKEFLGALVDLFLTARTEPFHAEPDTEACSVLARASWVLAGLTILCDWLGSDRTFFRFCETPMPLEVYWREHARPRARLAVEAAGVLPGRPAQRGALADLFPYIIRPTPLQEFADNASKAGRAGLYIFEDLTGSGKTEAALRLAQGLVVSGQANGLFFALPTMATSNAMYTRIEPLMTRLYQAEPRPSLVLSHSAARAMTVAGDTCMQADDDTKLAAAWLNDNRKKCLLATVGVGTVDQALITVLPIKHQSLRMLGLARSVLIVDEVHAYDYYMIHHLGNLLEHCSAVGTSVILLSATLPGRIREQLTAHYGTGFERVSSGGGAEPKPPESIPYPLATCLLEDTRRTEHIPVEVAAGGQRHVEIEFLHDSGTVVSRLIRQSRQGRCACWIRNTVSDAVESYAELARHLPEDRILLLHSRYALRDRLELERRILKHFGKESTPEQRNGRVVVATQVVEQSLDVDFDWLASDLAPVDLLIQRAGRLHRHIRPGRNNPVMALLSPRLDVPVTKDWYGALFLRGQYVYTDHGRLYLTARLLHEAGSLTVPQDSRQLLEGVYGEVAEERIPEALLPATNKAWAEALSLKSQARVTALNLSVGYVPMSSNDQWAEETHISTRLGEPTVTLSLAGLDQDIVVPLRGRGAQGWYLSQVRVAARLVASIDNESCTPEVLDEALATMPDQGRWSFLTVLIPGANGLQATGMDDRSRPVNLTYDRTIGLQISRQGG